LLELAVRGSWLDLTDGAIDGGEAVRWTVGANWYPTADTRISATWGLVDLERSGATGRTGIFQARWMILMGS
jgi:phosphate-selective porin OprO/OprP